MMHSLSVEKIKNVTIIKNHSKDFELIVSVKPIKPKRKYNDIYVVKPECFIMIEYDIDLMNLSYSFEKVMEESE